MVTKGKGGGSQRGVILISVYWIVAVMIGLAGALSAQALADIRGAQRTEAGARAFYLAESGIDGALDWLRSQPSPPAGTAQMVLFGGWQALGDGQYLVTVDPDDANPNSFIKWYRAEGWGAAGDPANPTSVRRSWMAIQMESFSRFAYFTNADTTPSGTPIWFISGDHIEGPTHTNGQFNMYGFPEFDGLVSSVSSTLNQWGGGPPTTSPVFNAGLQLGASQIPFPGSVPTSLINAASTGGSSFTGNTTVTLLANGTMQVTNAAQGLSNAVLPLPANGTLYVSGGDLSISGILNGQLTVGSQNHVKVTNSITYAADPVTDPNSDDLLGIVAGQNVKVASTAPANVTIQGSIMALGTSFTVENWNVAPPKGTLTVYGGITQKNRGPVGTFNSSTGLKVSGYTKDYHYDTRLQNQTPPYFPITGDYVPVVWDEER
ncbi:MAG: DUF4900 domain-containing protein [Candidatus Omnitrophica bacterium]|nr:DUF4900 domain-containing protein [Candidatus Omnitrophota bacterium]